MNLVSVQLSETHVIDEPEKVQELAAEPQEPAEEVQESTEAASAALAVEKSRQYRSQDGELLPAAQLTHHLDALSYQEPSHSNSHCREGAIPAAAVSWGMSCSGMINSVDSKSLPQGSIT